jgi:hypothetical protein
MAVGDARVFVVIPGRFDSAVEHLLKFSALASPAVVIKPEAFKNTKKPISRQGC